MRLARNPPTTQSERIYALEEGRKADGERLDKVETMVSETQTMVSEIHGLLVKARGVKWVFDNLFKIIGYAATVSLPAIGAWKFFTGH